MIYNILFSNFAYIKDLNDSKIPMLDDFGEFYEYIVEWNKLNEKCDLIFNYKKLKNHELEFCNFIGDIKNTLLSKHTPLFTITNDFYLFKKKFFSEYYPICKTLEEIIEKDNIKRNESLEQERIYDISTGIFSPQSADARSICFSIQYEISEEQIKIRNELKYLIDNFYFYLYIKTEQILHFISLFEKPKKKGHLYLPIKYELFIESNMFNRDKKFKKTKDIDKLNQIWIWFKHQDIRYKDCEDKIYFQKNIEKYLKEIDSIYKRTNEIINFTKIINDIDDYCDEIEGLSNPLGLTGFEID